MCTVLLGAYALPHDGQPDENMCEVSQAENNPGLSFSAADRRVPVPVRDHGVTAARTQSLSQFVRGLWTPNKKEAPVRVLRLLKVC